MSFIQETIKCKCGKFMNIALGTFGSGYPTKCSHCESTGPFEHTQSGWNANADGSWREDKLQDDFPSKNKE